jgi:predicted N-acyltransferase
MRVREASLDDKAIWDSFVDAEGGSFFHYFDWKHVYEAQGEQYIPLMIETAPSQIVGILPFVKRRTLLFSTLNSLPEGASGGIVLKRGLAEKERLEAILVLLESMDASYSRNCSTFTIKDNLTPVRQPDADPTASLVANGFRLRSDDSSGLPCTYFLELARPFEERVSKGWSRKLRQDQKKAVESGVVVVHDRELNYADVFVDMMCQTYIRHGSSPPTKRENAVRLDVFRDRSKLFVALLDGQPIVTLLCHYTPSTCYLAKMGSREKDTDNANKLCYRVAIEDACNAGHRFAEFGITPTSSQAFFKERFKGTRYPIRLYEKTYSVPRTLVRKAPVLLGNAWRDRSYIWHNRRKLWDQIIHI